MSSLETAQMATLIRTKKKKEEEGRGAVEDPPFHHRDLDKTSTKMTFWAGRDVALVVQKKLLLLHTRLLERNSEPFYSLPLAVYTHSTFERYKPFWLNFFAFSFLHVAGGIFWLFRGGERRGGRGERSRYKSSEDTERESSQKCVGTERGM